MIAQLLHVVVPVFAVAAAGWLFAGLRRIDLASLTDVVLYLAAPALVFHSLASQQLGTGSMLAVGGGIVFQIIACGVAAWIVFRLLRIEGRGLYLSAMFPNTGNLGLPLALFAFGPRGLAAAVIVYSTVNLIHYSFGLMMVSGSAHPGEALRMPLLHAAAFGVLAAVTGVVPPQPVMRGLELLGQAAVPLMLLSLGVRLRSVQLRRPALALLAVALRFIPGLAAAALWVSLLGLQGPERGVILVTGVLPPAVMNFVLAEVYGQQGEEVASSILLGTLLSIAAIPVVLALCT
jgi:predicted permease